MSAETVDSLRAREASEWLVKLHDDELSSEQISGWLEWSQAHPANLQAFEQVKALMRDLKGLDGGRKAVALERLVPQSIMPRSRGRMPVTRYAIAASVVAALGLGGYLVWQHQSQAQSFVRTYVTGKAEDRAFTLPDGTRVELGAQSVLNVRYTAGARSVELKAGEAFFRPETETNRPFRVTAGEWRMTDIGTAFNVRSTGGHVVVTVAEGIVDIAPRPGALKSADSPPLRLLAGEQAVMVHPALPPEEVSRVDIAAATSWVNGQLRFSNEPLWVAVANLNRYARREIILDPMLGELRFSGTVLTDNVEGWVEAICRVFSLTRESVGDGAVMLRSTPQTQVPSFDPSLDPIAPPGFSSGQRGTVEPPGNWAAPPSTWTVPSS